jgi:hypothetical protein
MFGLRLFLACATVLEVHGFATSEHILIGDRAILKFPSSGSQKASASGNTNKTFLKLPNGNSLSFGEIVALAGDLYGLPKAPISDATDTKGAFNSSASALLYSADRVQNQDPGAAQKKTPSLQYQSEVILAGPMSTVDAALAAAAAAGKIPSTAFATDAVVGLDKRWNVITGGGSVASSWLPCGRYLNLAQTNWDHFVPAGRAWKVYAAGHAMALDIAGDTKWKSGGGGGSSSSVERLTLAYAFEAFSLHFLTDMFSSGHLRTPRKIFPQECSPDDVGSYLSRYMHDEDCKYGLNVTNKKGDRWRAYGDKRYRDPVNEASRAVPHARGQPSVDAVWPAPPAAEGGKVEPGGVEGGGADSSDASTFGAASCIPTPLPDGRGNFYSLFAWDGNMLWRRNDISKLWDSSRKKHGGLSGWWSTTTLVELDKFYGPPSDLPPPPNSTALSDLLKQEAAVHNDVGRAAGSPSVMKQEMHIN